MSDSTRLHRSPQWRDGKFRNPWPRIDGSWATMTREFFFGGSPHRKPTAPVPVVPRGAADYDVAPISGLRVTWFGHSSFLLEIDGHRLLIDPMWGERAGPIGAPKRFFPPPLPLAEIPTVDAVVISHDHYDHLHADTIRHLARRGDRFITTLGVGDHLQRWGVPADRIVEADWWERTALGTLTLTATPARHFSGRTLVRNDRTLWAGFTIAGPRHRVFYSGDTAMHDQFAAIAQRDGPFDLTLIEAGAYDALWPDVHLGPEQAVRAHKLTGGALMIPLHWGLFDLALHGWTEPAERVLVAAEREGVRVAIPRPGELLEPALAGEVRKWWPDTPWKTADESPIVSHGFREAK